MNLAVAFVTLLRYHKSSCSESYSSMLFSLKAAKWMLAKGVAAAATMAGAAASSDDMLVRGAAKPTGSLSQADQA